MPNWCSTSIKILHPDKEKIAELYKNIDSWMRTNAVENGFTFWLGNVALNSGVAKYNPDNGDIDVRCRGEIVYLCVGENEIEIEEETAWCPMLEVWQRVCDKYLPDAEIIYSAIECGCEIYFSNDPMYQGMWFIDDWDDVLHGDSETVTEERLVEILQELTGLQSSNIDELYKEYLDSDLSDHMGIHRWENVDISELD